MENKLQQPKLHSKMDATELVKKVIEETVWGMLDWFTSEDIKIIQEDTGEELPKAKINIEENGESPFEKYIYPRLEKLGVHFLNKKP